MLPEVIAAPSEIEKLFESAKQFASPEAVDGPGGLRWQYDNSIIDIDRIREIVEKYRTLKSLIDRGIWTP
jgi:hypothetical protein